MVYHFQSIRDLFIYVYLKFYEKLSKFIFFGGAKELHFIVYWELFVFQFNAWNKELLNSYRRKS